jgi:hypothetical protein
MQSELVNWRRIARAGRSGLADIQREAGELERRAGVFQEFAPMLVPGLLQTPEYARRVFAAEAPDSHGIADAVAARMDRQTILYDPAKRCDFLMTEAALRWRVGPGPVQAAQLDRIRQVMTLSNVYVGVVPMDVEAPIWRYHGFVILDALAEGADPEVLVELLGYNVPPPPAEAVELYREAFRRLQEIAATGEELVRLLDRVARSIPSEPA